MPVGVKLKSVGSILVVALIAGGSCAPVDPRCAELAREDAYDFRVFPGLDQDSQYEAYICAQQHRHPPILDLAFVYAAEGESVARYLRVKLQSSPNDATTRDIIWVLRAIQVRNTYAVREDEGLMSLARGKVATMRDPSLQRFAQEWLSDIEASPSGPTQER